ncbi:hypothetical protein [Prosthecobacter sp.]|uniref:hypothetical protein n=1 Tax=Prosthecobacter sp. TaxID=1965333 RepID=UPI0037843D02
MNAVTSNSFAFRVWQQLKLEWRMQWLLVLLWLAALAMGCWQSFQETEPEITMPGFLPALLGLIVIVRSVRADAPGNTEVTSHVRPLGRGAVWLAKVVFFKIALLLPWLASDWPQWRGYGFGPVEWVAGTAGSALPAAYVGVCAALLASWSGPVWRNVLVGGVCIAVLELTTWMWGTVWRGEENVCVLAVARFILILTLTGAWWQVALRRRAWVTLVLGCVVTLLVAGLGNWNWHARPEQRFAETKLRLHFGERPVGAAQELWKGVYVTGLPEDCVVSVVAFAPAAGGGVWPPEKAFSDYAWTSEEGKVRHREHWMMMAHTRVLAPHYPAGALWRGNADLERAEELKKVVRNHTAVPWRLRLAVQQMKRVATMPLREAVRGEKRVVLDTGRRLDFQLNALSHDKEMRFWAMLRRRYPMLAPASRWEMLRVGGVFPEENFLVVLNSPGIREVCTACEENSSYSSGDGLYQRSHNRPAGFRFVHPSAQMDIAGLKLEEWVNGTTLDVWWPEERGVVDLEVSAEELGKVVSGGQ